MTSVRATIANTLLRLARWVNPPRIVGAHPRHNPGRFDRQDRHLTCLMGSEPTSEDLVASQMAQGVNVETSWTVPGQVGWLSMGRKYLFMIECPWEQIFCLSPICRRSGVLDILSPIDQGTVRQCASWRGCAASWKCVFSHGCGGGLKEVADHVFERIAVAGRRKSA